MYKALRTFVLYFLPVLMHSVYM